MVEVSRNQEQKPVRTSIRTPALKAVLAGLVVVLIVLAAASAIEYNQIQSLNSRVETSPTSIVQTTTITTSILSTTTVTAISTTTSTLTNAPGQGIQSAALANGIWSFTAFLATDSVSPGQPLKLTAVLTNISPANQTITDFVRPTIYPSVYASNGTVVWTWTPPQATWPSYTIQSDQSITSSVTIPTSQLSAGQIYSIKIGSVSIPSASNLTLTLQFDVSG